MHVPGLSATPTSMSHHARHQHSCRCPCCRTRARMMHIVAGTMLLHTSCAHSRIAQHTRTRELHTCTAVVHVTWPMQPPATDGRVDESAVCVGHALIVEPVPSEPCGQEVGEEHVCLPCQLPHQRCPFVRAQVNADGLLSTVVECEAVVDGITPLQLPAIAADSCLLNHQSPPIVTIKSSEHTAKPHSCYR